MYEIPSDTNFDLLYQGDIIKDIHILGAINLHSILYSTRDYTSIEKITSWHIPNEPTIGHVIVLSHSCEISLENVVKVTGIILAPLRDLNKATSKDKIRELISSNLIDQSQPSGSFLKYFYLEPNGNIPHDNGSVADFSKCFSVRKQSIDRLVQKKILQVKEEIRASMSLKLALYFHRTNSQ